MYLTKEEERMFNGDYGEAVALAIRTIVKVGEALKASRLVQIKHVHVSGVSFSNIGDPGYRFLKKIAELGGFVKTYTTVNPACIDLAGLSQVFSSELRYGQLLINNVLRQLGVRETYTCIPYIVRRPAIHEHLAWGESNAVVMANSFYGARTNREGGPITVMAALTGRIYYSGLHIFENRVVSTKIEMKVPSLNDKYAGLLGLYIGERVEGIPKITGVSLGFSEMKELFASSAASGNHALVVLDKVTPRHSYVDNNSVEKIIVDKKELDTYYDNISAPLEIYGKVLVYIGCPHLLLQEVEDLIDYILAHGGLKRDIVLLLTIPYHYHKLLSFNIEGLREKGIELVFGACPIVSKLTEKPDIVLTNSGKALFYLTKLHKYRVVLGSLKDILGVIVRH